MGLLSIFSVWKNGVLILFIYLFNEYIGGFGYMLFQFNTGLLVCEPCFVCMLVVYGNFKHN